jgi:hypothetical protein
MTFKMFHEALDNLNFDLEFLAMEWKGNIHEIQWKTKG